MGRSAWIILLIAGLPALGGCAEATGPTEEARTRCPERVGRFSPTACAVVQARALDHEGAPLRGIAIRVDSMYLGVFYYSAATVRTDSLGAFELMVSRPWMGSQSPPTSPDTVTVRVRAYLMSGFPGPLAEPDASAAVTATFAPAGELAPVTSAELRFLFEP